VEVALFDVVVATHAFLRVIYSPPTSKGIGLFSRWRTRRTIAATIHACHQMLTTMVSPVYHATTTTSENVPLVERLRPIYPQTVATFAAMGASDELERVWRLEQAWHRTMNGAYDETLYELHPDSAYTTASSSNDESNTTDFDLIYAGGGLGLLHAAVMAVCYHQRVMVFDKGKIGCAHREWNISREELQALVTLGVVTWDDLAAVVMREYRTGLVQFYTGPATKIPHSELWMEHVLSLAIDSEAMLQLMRRKVEEAGGIIFDYYTFHRVHVFTGAPQCVSVEIAGNTTGDNVEVYSARLLLDCMGSTSPLALLRHAGMPFAGVCPTVGSTVCGFAEGDGPREYDPTVGDILISVADTQHNRQLIWEGFPGREDETAVYVFYYAALNGNTPGTQHTALPSSYPHQTPYSLLELFEHYFTLHHTYKKPGADFRHIKPLYGYIPGRHSVNANESPLLQGVLPIGDSAAQQSPLTYCGFGSHVRNLHRTTSLLAYALQHELLSPKHLNHINAFQTNVSLNWVFSRFMQPWGHPDNVNELQNVFLGSLNDLGVPIARRFFQDCTRWSDYNHILGTVLRRYPIIMNQAWSVLKPSGITQWGRDYLRFTLEASYAATARVAGPTVENMVYRLADRLSPAQGLSIRARYAEWHAMKWLEPLEK
jgi:lycopene cyclase CruA